MFSKFRFDHKHRELKRTSHLHGRPQRYEAKEYVVAKVRTRKVQKHHH